MLFMVIETFRDQDAKSVYRRFRERGRLAGVALRKRFAHALRSRSAALMCGAAVRRHHRRGAG
jgi:hypothetical protein